MGAASSGIRKCKKLKKTVTRGQRKADSNQTTYAAEAEHRMEALSSQQHLYNEVAIASEQETMNDALLLPSVEVPKSSEPFLT